MPLSILKAACVLASLFLFSCANTMKTSREPNQVTNVGGGKSSLLDIKLFSTIIENSDMSETSRRVNYRVYNVICRTEEACSFTGVYGKRYQITGERARNISTLIGVDQKVATLTCSNWFDGYNGKELEFEQASAAGYITCESK